MVFDFVLLRLPIINKMKYKFITLELSMRLLALTFRNYTNRVVGFES